jgi:hypothetical protein
MNETTKNETRKNTDAWKNNRDNEVGLFKWGIGYDMSFLVRVDIGCFFSFCAHRWMGFLCLRLVYLANPHQFCH